MFFRHSVVRIQQTIDFEFDIRILLTTRIAGRGATARFAKANGGESKKPGSIWNRAFSIFNFGAATLQI
jgi:hypothetical protein